MLPSIIVFKRQETRLDSIVQRRAGKSRAVKRLFFPLLNGDHITLKQPTMADATHAIPDPQPQHKQTDGPIGLPPVPQEMHDEELELHDADPQTRVVVRSPALNSRFAHFARFPVFVKLTLVYTTLFSMTSAPNMDWRLCETVLMALSHTILIRP